MDSSERIELLQNVLQYDSKEMKVLTTLDRILIHQEISARMRNKQKIQPENLREKIRNVENLIKKGEWKPESII